MTSRRRSRGHCQMTTRLSAPAVLSCAQKAVGSFFRSAAARSDCALLFFWRAKDAM